MSTEKALLVEIDNNSKEIVEISELAQKLLARDNKITITNAMAIPTVVNQFLRATVSYLAQHKSSDTEVVLDILGYLDMGVSYRTNDGDAETGNFAPYATPGPVFKKAIKDNDITEDDEE